MARRARLRYRLGVPSTRAIVRWLAPALLAIVVMLPRLASPQFGLLDDGVTLAAGRETLDRWSSILTLVAETGRFRPAYWLLYSAVFGVVGVRAVAFFVANVLLFMALLGLLARLVRLSGGSSLQAALTVVVFAVCGPAVETFYTLSKAEAFQVLCIGVSLLAAGASASEPRRARRVGLGMLAGVALLLACMTKETTLVLIPISLGWIAIERSSGAKRDIGARFATTYAAVGVVAGAVFWMLRWHYSLPLAEGTYTRAYALQIDTVGPALFRISAWIARDFAFLVPLSGAAVLIARRGRPEWRRQMLYACVWSASWLIVYLPWPATFEYYLLPFAAGAAILAGGIAASLWDMARRDRSIAVRRVAWSTLAASGLLWLAAIGNAAADARVQLTVDRANADLVDFLADLPTGSRIVLNTTEANEYLYEVPLHLAEIKKRPDLRVQHVGERAPADDPPIQTFVITPTIADRPALTVRIAVNESGVRRDATRLRAMLRERGELVYTTEHHARLVEFALPRLLCPVARSPFADATYCPRDRGIVSARTFSYGWAVHRIPAAHDESV